MSTDVVDLTVFQEHFVQLPQRVHSHRGAPTWPQYGLSSQQEVASNHPSCDHLIMLETLGRNAIVKMNMAEELSIAPILQMCLGNGADRDVVDRL